MAFFLFPCRALLPSHGKQSERPVVASAPPAETIPKDKFFVEFITYFVSFLICVIIFFLGLRRVSNIFDPKESINAKKEQYIVRYIKEKNAPKQ